MINNDIQKNPYVGALAGGAGIGLVGFGVNHSLQHLKIGAIAFDACNLHHYSRVGCALGVYVAPVTFIVNVVAPIVVTSIALVAAKHCFNVAKKNLD